MRHTLLLILVSLFSAMSASTALADERANASSYFLRGIVCDSISGEPLPRASILIGDGSHGIVSDGKGIFELSLPRGSDRIKVSCLGYESKTVHIERNRLNMIAVYLCPSSTELSEVIVRREKYSKQNNPALDLAKMIRENAAKGDPERHDYYHYDKYERITLALNNFNPDRNGFIIRRFPFLREYIDTSEVSGNPILNVSVKEKASTVEYRRKPHARKTTVRGFRTTGIDRIGNADNTQIYLEDVLREIDLYDNDINILQNRFVSPLSPMAANFYKFYLTDTVKVDGHDCAVLSFYPFNRSSFGFTGHLYVTLGDTAMTIRRVEMNVPREINLNFVDHFYLSQTYETASDGTRLKTRDDLTIELTMIPGTQGLYIRRNTTYGSHSFDPPADTSIFDGLQKEIELDSARCRSEQFWDMARLSPIPKQEKQVDQMLVRLGKSKFFYWSARAVNALVEGYVPIGHKFDYGPINTTVSFNDIEGTRLRIGGMTTSYLSRRWFARGFAAYGTKDRKWKYKAEVEYSFHDKKRHSREFPIHSLRLTHLYDIENVGQHYSFTNPDNVFLSLKRMSDHNVIYHRISDLQYTLELHNNFSVTAILRHDRREATPWIPFIDGHGTAFSHYNESSLNISLRYAPGEKFYQSRSNRYPVNLDAPIVMLSHTYSPAGVFGSKYPVNKTELSMQKRFWLSAFGYVDAMVSGAHVWSRSVYLDLIIPNANLSYTIQPESFALLNPMEFINDSQVSWFVTYWANGALFNLIPGLKKLKLREAFSFSGFYGHLSDRNLPSSDPSLPVFPPGATITHMGKEPYMEASIGVDNIFKCLRVDYVWRLNYRHPPYEIDRSGVRIAFHATF